MSYKELIEKYSEEVRNQFNTGHAKEHAYRPALERLMSGFENTIAVNDPKRSEHGNPDFIFLKKDNRNIIKGYAEAKDIDVNLDKTEKTNQMHRYAGYENLYLTNYLEFRFYQNGTKYQELSIGSIKNGELILDPANYQRLADELQQFLELKPERIRSGLRLAQIMGAKARRIRDNVKLFLDHELNESNQELEKIYELMKELLVHDLSKAKFADMYAQTLVYGLFVARYSDSSPEDFNRTEARDLVPSYNPFLREFFDHIVGPRFDKRLAYIVDELCEVYSVSDVNSLIHKHLKIDSASQDKDPIIHFYEDFLKEYDPEERKKMGAYYTPVPVVQFMIREVDSLIKSEFGMPDGIMDSSKKSVKLKTQGMLHKVDMHGVQILDPAVGTATFLNEIIKYIHGNFTGQEGRWNSYAKNELLPRIHGFELMMAPYTIAHLKLAMTLQDMGVPDTGQRLGVYLTNTLDEGQKHQLDLFNFGLAEVVTQESQKASEIKHDRPVFVIIGNPPYSGESSNKTEYATKLVEKYKVEPGGLQKLQERNAKWINDDYVKFLAFAEDMVDKNGVGIVAMITNHSYLDNTTFRGMRWHLAKTFDKMFILDLHGNYKKSEVAPDGSKDENVFDIMQGVSIILAVKTTKSNKDAEVYHADIYGKRKSKFEQLSKPIQWSKLTLDQKMYYFVKKDTTGKSKYETGVPLDQMFIKNTLGFQTHRDSFAVALSKDELKSRIVDLESDATDAEIKDKYQLKESSSWKLAEIREKIRSYSEEKIEQLLVECAYRPFDNRYTFFDESVSDRPRKLIKDSVLSRVNVSIECSKQIANLPWQHAFVANCPAESCLVSNKTKEGNYSFPLYLYDEGDEKHVNISSTAIKAFEDSIKDSVSPEDIFYYSYAILNSNKYRNTYKEFLKTDFPFIPVPKTKNEFTSLADLGQKLSDAQLMKTTTSISTTYPVAGSDTVDKLEYKEDQVWINSEQYFGGVPSNVWDYEIGSYRPAQKWLKDRIGRKLNDGDITHYQRLVQAISESLTIVSKLDS